MHDLTFLPDYKCLLAAGLEIRPLTDQEARTFLGASCAETMDGADAHALMETQIEADKELLGLGYKILNARLQLAGIKTTPHLRLFVASLIHTPGEAVMWAYTLALIAEAEEGPVTVSAWTERFPMGVPTDNAMSKVWDAQKRARPTTNATDNWLDVAPQWPSIRRQLEAENARLKEKS